MEPNSNMPLPVIDDLTRPFWDAARAHRLVVQRCQACGDVHFPPSPVCPACLSEDQVWQEASGRATLLSWATFHRAYWDGVKDAVPYDVCVVRLAEGPLMVSNFAGPTPEGLRLGLPLAAVFHDVAPEVSVVRWVVAGA